MTAPSDPGLARREAVVGAAYNTFMAIGFAKTSMSDIAAAAHISRPTLYRLFENKNELFVAVVDRLHDEAHQRYKAESDLAGTLAQRLARVGVAKVTTVLDVLESSVHGAELLDVNQRVAGASAAAANDRLMALLSAMFRSADGEEIDLDGAGLNSSAASRIMLAIVDGWVVALTSTSQRSARRWSGELSRAIDLLVKGMQRS